MSDFRILHVLKLCEELNMDGDQITNVADSANPSTLNPVKVAAMKLATLSYSPGSALAAIARQNIFEALSKAGPNAELTSAEIAAVALPGKSINTYLLVASPTHDNPTRNRDHEHHGHQGRHDAFVSTVHVHGSIFPN